MDVDKSLEEDSGVDFKGATLRITSDAYNLNQGEKSDCDHAKKHLLSETDGNKLNNNPKGNVQNDNLKPLWSGADVISPIAALPKRISATIWGSKTTESKEETVTEVKNDNVHQTRMDVMVCKQVEKENPKNFFTFRDGLMENAVKECIENLLVDNDGVLIGSWLLTEISLWDSEKERLILLTENTLVTVKYDFIALRQLEYRKVPLCKIDTLVIGDLIYPSTSLVPDRGTKGVRIMWNKGQPISLTKLWNPFTQDIPLSTYSSHPLFWHKECEDNRRQAYDIEDFGRRAMDAVERVQTKNPEFSSVCKFLHKPVILQNYMSLGSIIHNRNSLGFFKVRGKFSF